MTASRIDTKVLFGVLFWIHDQRPGYVFGFNHTTERQHRDTQQAVYLYEMGVL